MSSIIRIIFLILYLFSSSSSFAYNYSNEIREKIKHQDLTPDEKNNITVFEKNYRSVVYIQNTQYIQNAFSFNIEEIPKGTGTGFIWNKEGLIITNYHVIKGASKINVSLADQSNWDAEIIGVAPDKDLAVLKIKAPSKQLYPIEIGNSNNLFVGRKVLAIGNPFGLDLSLTVGVVSALGREISSLTGRTIKHLIQTDAAINPGNSGGPLLNSAGKLIGVNTAIYSPSGSNAGVGFAIPVSTIKKIIPMLVKYGKIQRAFLGIQTVEDSITERNGIKGLIILKTTKRGNAHKSGIEGIRRNRFGNIILGDVIQEINGIKIRNNDDLLSLLEEYKAGDLVKVSTFKKGTKKTYWIKLSQN